MRFVGLDEKNVTRALDEWYAPPSPVWGKGSAWFTNIYVRELSGIDDAYGQEHVGDLELQRATDAIHLFDVLMILEKLEEDLVQLCVLGWTHTDDIFLNVNKDGAAKVHDVHQLDPVFHERLAAANRLDSALFATAKARSDVLTARAAAAASRAQLQCAGTHKRQRRCLRPRDGRSGGAPT